MVTRRRSSSKNGIRKTVTESKKGRSTSVSQRSNKSKTSGTRTTTSYNSKTGKISKYVTTKLGSFFKRKKVK